MKKILLILMAMVAFGIQNISAQDGIKIVTNHPDFKVKVVRCAVSGTTAIIDLNFINIGSNDIDELVVYGGAAKSEAIDSDGNIYNENNIKVKLSKETEYHNYRCPLSMPTDVPMKITVKLENFSKAAEAIARLKLTVNCRPWGLTEDKPLRISNIPITRE